jgi:hypothetical protein
MLQMVRFEVEISASVDGFLYTLVANVVSFLMSRTSRKWITLSEGCFVILGGGGGLSTSCIKKALLHELHGEVQSLGSKVNDNTKVGTVADITKDV